MFEWSSVVVKNKCRNEYILQGGNSGCDVHEGVNISRKISLELGNYHFFVHGGEYEHGCAV